MRTRLLKTLPIIIPLFAVLFLLLRQVNLPYVGPNATDMNTISLAARNMNNWGYLNTKFVPIKTVSPTISWTGDNYLRHPPLMTIIQSLFYRFLGYDFWVGRIAMVIPAFLSIVLLFLIAGQLAERKYALTTLVFAVLIPASIVFGRMLVFPGPWTMFFILSTAFFSLKFIKTKEKAYFYLAIFTTVLGTLTDWPMVYFTVFLFPLFYKNKAKREGFYLTAASVVTILLFFVYVFWVLGNFQQLVNAILTRSLGPLLFSLPFWPLHWASIIIIRLIIYFNPLFVTLSTMYIFYFIKKLRSKKLENKDLVIFAFFALGATQMTMYPETAFTHPFWSYPIFPFIALSASDMFLQKFNKKFALYTTLLMLFSIIFLLRIEDWKTKQDTTETFRYNLAKQMSVYFKPYETLAVNNGSIIDRDLLAYVFYQKTVPVNLPTENFKDAGLYAYTCFGCSINSPEVNFLANRYQFKQFSSPPGAGFLFFLNQKQTGHFEIQKNGTEASASAILKAEPPKSFLRQMYMDLMGFLQVPQI